MIMLEKLRMAAQELNAKTGLETPIDLNLEFDALVHDIGLVCSSVDIDDLDLYTPETRDIIIDNKMFDIFL